MSSSDKSRGNLANGAPPPVGSDAYAAWLERSTDGLLCSGRDTLQSRTGASCGVRRLSHLVAVKGG